VNRSKRTLQARQDPRDCARGYPGFTQERAVLATFGQPARTYHVGSYTVLVWDKNLLSELG
jgi:hypothetical protein